MFERILSPPLRPRTSNRYFSLTYIILENIIYSQFNDRMWINYRFWFGFDVKSFITRFNPIAWTLSPSSHLILWNLWFSYFVHIAGAHYATVYYCSTFTIHFDHLKFMRGELDVKGLIMNLLLVPRLKRNFEIYHNPLVPGGNKRSYVLKQTCN